MSENKGIVDFNEVRAQKLEEKRRKTERIFFKSLLSVYTVLDTGNGKDHLQSIELMDLSDEGLSFIAPFDPKSPWPANAKEIPLRLYFSQDTYLPVHVTIQNSSSFIESGKRYVRYGCAVDKGLTSYDAYKQFVRFMRLYAEHAHKDQGDVTVFYL